LPIAAQIKAHHAQTVVMSLGGATEGSIWSIWHEIKEEQSFVPYGQAMPNQKMYVLNHFGDHCPVGVTGELYIGGEGVALGYWLNQESTTRAFITHSRLGRLYKTGDFGRLHQEGYIEFLGRQDTQVKRHGYRVELAEIAMKLKQIAGIDDALVRLHDNRLIAYLLLKKIPDLSAQEHHDEVYPINSEFVELIKHELEQYLPHYMLPDAYIGLTKTVLTSNGKLDYSALPVPEFNSNQPLFVAPRTELEAQIALIWGEVLGIQQISIRDNFFNIGGDSISSIQVASKLRYAAIDCRVKDLFEHRTIEQLAFYLSGKMSHAILDTEQGLLTGEFALAPLQKWFFSHCLNNNYDWNQSYLVKVPSLSLARLQEVAGQLVAHHDLLRARFAINDLGEMEQRYDATIDFVIEQTNILTLPNHDPKMVLNAWKHEFDWALAPLWRLDYIDGYADGSARLLLTLHPIIADPVSTRIVLTDLQRLYQGLPLARKGTSYRQWQQLMYDYAIQHPEALDFWMEHKTHELSLVAVQESIRHQSFHLDSVLTEQLVHQANQAYHTEINDLLLTALTYALNECTGQQAHSITMMGHGREPVNERMEVSETVGLFTSMYPVHCTLRNSLSESILDMKEYVRSIPHKGATYSDLVHYHGVDEELPSIHFGYLGQFVNQNEEWQLLTDELSTQVHPAHASHYVLAVHCWIVDNVLHVDFGSRVSEQCSKNLVTSFKSWLIKVIHHCMQQVGRGSRKYTKSDFKTVKTEGDLKSLPLYHDRDGQGQSFSMSEIQKAYTLGRLGQFEIGNVANHFYREFYFEELDTLRLERALNRLIAHYPETRLVFDQYSLTQRYLAFDKHTYYRIETRVISGPYTENALVAIRERLSHHVYDIGRYPLYNLSLTRFSDRVILHFSFDMILFDLKTVTQFYTLLTHLYQDDNFYLPKSKVNFRDYQCYMDLLKSSHWYESDQAYWREKIKTMPLRPKLSFACDPRLLEKPQFTMHHQSVDGATWQKFKRQADRYGISYGSALLALYGCILSHCSTNKNFLITLTLLNRYSIHADIDSLWGDFTSVNLFAFSGQTGCALDLLKHTHDSLWSDMAHALYSGLNVQRDLMVLHRLDPSLAVSPIVFTCVLDDSSSGVGALPYFLNSSERSDERYLIGQTSQAWIDLQVTEQQGCLYSHWLYVSQLFPEHFIAELNEGYCSLISYLADNDWDRPLPFIDLSYFQTMAQASKTTLKHQEVIKNHLQELTGVDQILLREEDDYFLAYLVEPSLPVMMDEQKMEVFKVAEKGLRQDLIVNYAFKLTLDETEYRRCKSYRHFAPMTLADQTHLLPELAPFSVSTSGRPPHSEELALILSPLSALRLKDKMLAKYKYPSAGHSYSIQTYLHIPNAMGKLPPGVYYYHPVSHALQIIEDTAIAIGPELAFEFRVYRPAIEPLYTEDWLRFSCLELGHMLYLLSSTLQMKDIGYEFNWTDLSVDDPEFYSLARLTFGSDTNKILSNELSAHLLHKTAAVFRDGKRSVDLNKLSLLLRESAVGQVLESAPAVCFFEGINDKNSWVQAGFQAQYLMGYWQQFMIGSCSLAFKPSNDSVYALALGIITEEEKLQAESSSIPSTGLDEQLTMALSQSLPEGRLPDAYITLNQLPLTSTGSIDWEALPIPDFHLGEREYCAPRSQLEQQLCDVWQEVLGIPKIGIFDDFFRLGGDSILSMQVTAKLRQLGIDCSVKSIFEHRYIESLLVDVRPLVANEIEAQQSESQDNFIYADISPELMEFLQQSYE
jgi:non-ribosomal peptide synthase protein (TIGR01720 family)